MTIGTRSLLALSAVLVATSTAMAAGLDVQAEVERYRALVSSPEAFRPDNAADLLNEAHAELFALDPQAVDYTKIDDDPEAVIRSLFTLCLALDERCAEFYEQGLLSEEIANAKRRALRGIRYMREAIALRLQAKQPARIYEKGKPAFAETFGKQYWTFREDAQGLTPSEFPRTYVILCMGSSNVSAAIARSAEENNTFSHLGIGYRSDAPHTIKETTYPAGTLFVVEALIETGVIIHPLEEHYSSSDRDVIFFVRDPQKQAAVDAAADAFFERAKQGINSGEPLGYDFSMGSGRGMSDVLDPGQGAESARPTPKDPDSYFCAAVGEEIFAKAGVELFTTKTRLKQGEVSGDMFESWGIDPTQPMSAPGDADVSANLTRVAEGCVLESLELNHVRQAVLYAMFSWMDGLNYRLRWPWWFTATSSVLARFNDSWVDLGLVPSGMGVDTLRTSYALDKAATLYVERMLAEAAAFKIEQGRAMTPMEMLARMDELRDAVKGTDAWFRRAPRALGRFAMNSQRGKTRVELIVSNGPGMEFNVERIVRSDAGEVLSHSRGSGSQKDGKLTARLRHVSGTRAPRTIWYTLELDGSIRGRARVDRRGRPATGNDAHTRTIERSE